MKILTLIGCYLPGFKAGGQIRSLSNLVDAFDGEHEFYIVTRDRDLGDKYPYTNVVSEEWIRVGNANVRYLAAGPASAQALRRTIAEMQPDMVYSNSPFDFWFGVVPLLLDRFGGIKKIPSLISAHGIFAPNALAIKSHKKKTFLWLDRYLNLMRSTHWHATCAEEAQDIFRVFGRNVRVTVAPNLCTALPNEIDARQPKQAGRLRLALLGRVARIKNIDGAIKIVRDLKTPTTLDIYGPLEDQTYWQECQNLLVGLSRHIQINYRGLLLPTEIHTTLATYDAMFLPTNNENFAYAVVESFSSGCPVVISDRTPWRNLRNRGVGWDVPLEDHDAFGKVLAELAMMTELEHSVMRLKARKYAATVSDSKPTLQLYRELFKNVSMKRESLKHRRAA